MAFNKYYGSVRGHYYTLQDVTSTGRPHALANCFTCKTPDFTAMVNNEGVSAYTMPFEDRLAKVNESVSCYNCHANTPGELVVTHTYLADSMAAGSYSEDELHAIRALNRKGPFYWDFVFMENSEGAHNSRLTTECLDKAEAPIDEALGLFKQ